MEVAASVISRRTEGKAESRVKLHAQTAEHVTHSSQPGGTVQVQDYHNTMVEQEARLKTKGGSSTPL